MLLDSYIVYLIQRELDYGLQNMLLVFCCAFAAFHLLQVVIKAIIEIRKLPPGPYGIFPFGILKFIGDEKHKEFMKLAKTYGPLFSCKLGMQLYVVISDYKLIREILNKGSVTDRPKTPLYAVLNGAGKFLPFCQAFNLRKVRVMTSICLYFFPNFDR